MARKREHTEEIANLKKKGLKNKDIAKLLDINMSTVSQNLQITKEEEKSLSQFNRDLPNHLTKIIGKLVQQFTKTDLDKVSPYQLAGMLSLMIDKQRLLSGQSTSNQAVLFHIVEQACRDKSPEENEGGG